MASASKLELVSRTLRSVLLSEKGGVAISRLQGDYRELTGEPLPYKEFGYSSLEAYLKSIPNVVSLQRGPDGTLLCNGVTDDVTQRIGSLISRQKGKKTKRSGSKPKPGRSYARPTYVSRPKPVYNNQFNPSYKPRPVRPKFQTRLPTFQSTNIAHANGKFQKQQNWTKPGQSSTNPVCPAKPSQQFKPLQSTYAKRSNSAEGDKPKQQTVPIYFQSTTREDSTKSPIGTSTGSASASKSQQPTPGPWSGKLGSKRNQQQPASLSPAADWQSQPAVNHSAEQSHQPTKPIQQNIFITVDNDYYQQEKSPNKGKTKAAKGKKPEWSSNFEVPPRFKKLTSPTATTAVQADSNPSEVNQVTSGQPGSTQISSTTSSWIQKTLREKPNGVWASALRDMHLKEFSKALDEDVINEMAKLNLIQKESIYNNDILYPKLTVTVKDSQAAKTTKRSVAMPDKQEVVEEAGDQTENGTIHRNGDPTGSSATEFRPISSAIDERTKQTSSSNIFTASSTNIVRNNQSSSSSPPRTISPCAQSLGNNALPSNQFPRNSLPQDSLQGRGDSTNASQIADRLADMHFPSNGSPSFIPSEETSSEPSEGWGLPTMEAPGVPSMQLPEEDEWDVYVAYIQSVSDFYVILIGEDYSEQLIVLEEEMRTFYQCCTWTLTEPPEEGDCYAAEFKREWLRVEVKAVQGDKVQCFLLDHGDMETADVTSLRPLSETFLQLPFQVVHCKLSGSEQVAEDDSTALQMFCQLALGKNLLAEVTSRDGDRVAMELFDDSDVSILEQCMTAGI